jgi:myo-inositol-1-phosphate synthase
MGVSMSELTLAVAGLSGSVGTTLAAGLAAIRGGGPARSLLTELPWPLGSAGEPSLASRLDLAKLSSLGVTGWDLDTRPLAESVREKGILPHELLDAVTPELEHLVPWPAISSPRAEFLDRARAELEKLISSGQDVVMVDLLPAAATPPQSWDLDVAELEKALFDDYPGVTPSMAFAWLAFSTGVPYLNFTPNVTVELPALRELARRRKTPFCGKDGKTGQTLMKTALAPMLALRGLKVEGWISANYLGNADGENLADPENAAEKLRNKKKVLEQILGYEVDSHIVDIRHYRPRGDFKEAWDNIDFTGFCGVPMQLKVNFLCGDSVLAAPVVIDAARLLDRAARAGASGPQAQLSLFFKSPIADGGAEQDLFRQRSLLEEWVVEACDASTTSRPKAVVGS